MTTRREEFLCGAVDDRDSLRRGRAFERLLALLGFRDAVVMLRRGDIASSDVFLWPSAVDEERTRKVGGIEVLAAMKVRRPFLTPTSLALKGTNVPPDGKMGELRSVSVERGLFRLSSRIELLVVSRLIEDRRITESFRK